MNKIVCGLLFSIFFTTSSFSASALDFLKHKSVRHLIANKSKGLQKKNYSDFSGEWKGTCVSEKGESPSFTLTIQQNDHAINYIFEGGESVAYAINAVETSAYTSNAYHDTTESTLHWDEEGKVLIFNFHLSDFGNYSGPTPIVAQMGRSTWQLQNAQLIVNIDEHNFEGEETYTEHAMCTFSKLQE